MSSILVVGDDSKRLATLRQILDDTPYEAAFLDDDRLILERLSDLKPDLVMLELKKSAAASRELCRQIKSHENGRNVMVLVVSAQRALEDRLADCADLADDFIAKPFGAVELKAKLLTLIRLKTAQDELRRLNAKLEELVQDRTCELIKSERSALVGDMLRGIVHNFQSPLCVISSCIDMTASAVSDCFDERAGQTHPRCENANRIKHNLDLMQQAAARINAMIAGLLAYGSLNGGAKKEAVNLNEFIKGELDFLNGNLELKRKVLVQFAFDNELPVVAVASAELAQVVANLVNNAVDAMRDQPRRELVIATHHDDENVYVDFRDSGSGIAPENLARIFDPFFTTKERRSALEGGGGTGLGLSISLQLMQTMGGDIAVRSRIGDGTVFSLRLPRSAS